MELVASQITRNKSFDQWFVRNDENNFKVDFKSPPSNINPQYFSTHKLIDLGPNVLLRVLLKKNSKISPHSVFGAVA